MKSSSKKRGLSFILAGVAGLALLVGVAQPAKAVNSANPSAGATIVPHAVAKDQNGNLFGGNYDLGFKVFVVNDAAPHLVVDENGTAPANGVIDRICISSGTAGEWAVVYDSATTGALTAANAGTGASQLLEITAPVVRTTTQVNCQQYDAQFWNGAVVLQTGIALGGTAHVYWRPGRGGAQ